MNRYAVILRDYPVQENFAIWPFFTNRSTLTTLLNVNDAFWRLCRPRVDKTSTINPKSVRGNFRHAKCSSHMSAQSFLKNRTKMH
ncbi:hypothetical protein BDB00DRAFT_848120 [Zychaea mexicana]|uniref:uncharacterized protein n=1 Tax=Zychaea mexicana TaxID=64656 RepID=UPI0022FE1728|nr:uncharacterized protein BDB00DRAFT_848120 [Zychaea mexicana]KAI9488459.1 hypothetical protein BDB00DRAFT_848120 [Zychaea mexicana]